MSWVGSKPRIACVASDSAPARAAQADLAARYDLVDLDDGDVIVALGGDGLLLHTIHDHLQLGRPIFGMNRGTVGFLMNQYRPDGLVERVAAATPISVHPLRLAATYTDGRRADALAFNEVAVTRLSVHSANLRLSIDGVERMAKFVGDGLIVATCTTQHPRATLRVGCGLRGLPVQHHAGQGAGDAVQDLNTEDNKPAQLIEAGRLHFGDDVVGTSEVLSQLHTIKICDRLGNMSDLADFALD
jgi:hypothetical protein